MHGPAPVSLDAAGDGGAWRWAVAGLHGLAAAALLAWRPTPWTALAALLLILLALRIWRQTPVAQRLAWDGQAWQLDGRPVRPTVTLDLGGWMLLQLRGAGFVSSWLPLSPARAGGDWPALRAALHAVPVQAA